jgi:signal transduction histidine kinase
LKTSDGSTAILFEKKAPSKDGAIVSPKLTIMKRIILFAALASAITMTQCNRSAENRVDETQEEIVDDIKEEKAELAKDLRELRDDINNRLDKVSKELEDGSIDARKDLDDVKQKLTEQRDKAEKALDQISNSSDETWDDIQQASRNTASEVKLEFQKLGERIDLALDNARDGDLDDDDKNEK